MGHACANDEWTDLGITDTSGLFCGLLQRFVPRPASPADSRREATARFSYVYLLVSDRLVGK